MLISSNEKNIFNTRIESPLLFEILFASDICQNYITDNQKLEK